jgi:hypothetical protein
MQHTRRIETDSDWRDLQALVFGESRPFFRSFKKFLALDEREKLFCLNETPFYQHGLLAAFGHWRDERLVAVVCAVSDVQMIRERREKVGFLGFFAHESGTSQDCADRLIDLALNWLRQEGLKAVLAPVDLYFFRSARWTQNSEDEVFWGPSLERKNFHAVDRGFDLELDLQTHSWPPPFEARAEIAQQSTRIRLKKMSRLPALMESLAALWSPGAVRDQVERDLELRKWISKSDINRTPGGSPPPWCGVPHEADWLSWRREASTRSFELEGDILGRRAVWVRGTWSSGGRSQVHIQRVEMDPAFREFDLLPWVLISVARWCEEKGARFMIWSALSEETPLSKVLIEGLGRSGLQPKILRGAAL